MLSTSSFFAAYLLALCLFGGAEGRQTAFSVRCIDKAMVDTMCISVVSELGDLAARCHGIWGSNPCSKLSGCKYGYYYEKQGCPVFCQKNQPCENWFSKTIFRGRLTTIDDALNAFVGCWGLESEIAQNPQAAAFVAGGFCPTTKASKNCDRVVNAPFFEGSAFMVQTPDVAFNSNCWLKCEDAEQNATTCFETKELPIYIPALFTVDEDIFCLATKKEVKELEDPPAALRSRELPGFNRHVKAIRGGWSCDWQGRERDLECAEKIAKQQEVCLASPDANYTFLAECVWKGVRGDGCRYNCYDSKGRVASCFGLDVSRPFPTSAIDEEILCTKPMHEGGFNAAVSNVNEIHTCGLLGHKPDELCDRAVFRAQADCTVGMNVSYTLFSECLYETMKNWEEENGRNESSRCSWTCRDDDLNAVPCFGMGRSQSVPLPSIDEELLCNATSEVTGYNPDVVEVRDGLSCYVDSCEDSVCAERVMRAQADCFASSYRNYVMLSECVHTAVNQPGLSEVCRWTCADKRGRGVSCYGSEFSPPIPPEHWDEHLLCHARSTISGFNQGVVNASSSHTCKLEGLKKDVECNRHLQETLTLCRQAPSSMYILLSECLLTESLKNDALSSCSWKCLDAEGGVTSCFGSDQSLPIPQPALDEGAFCHMPLDLNASASFSKSAAHVSNGHRCAEEAAPSRRLADLAGVAPGSHNACQQAVDEAGKVCRDASKMNGTESYVACVFENVLEGGVGRCSWNCADKTGEQISCFGNEGRFAPDSSEWDSGPLYVDFNRRADTTWKSLKIVAATCVVLTVLLLVGVLVISAFIVMKKRRQAALFEDIREACMDYDNVEVCGDFKKSKIDGEEKEAAEWDESFDASTIRGDDSLPPVLWAARPQNYRSSKKKGKKKRSKPSSSSTAATLCDV